MKLNPLFAVFFFFYLSLDTELIRSSSLLVSIHVSFHFPEFYSDCIQWLWRTFYFCTEICQESKTGISSGDSSSCVTSLLIVSLNGFVFFRERFVDLNANDFPKKSHLWSSYILQKFIVVPDTKGTAKITPV